MRVLLLEDTEDRQSFFKKLYTGHDIHIHNTVEECVDQMRRIVFDQIWLDHDLGGAQYMESGPGSGYEVIKPMLAKDIYDLQKNAFVYIHSQNPAGAVRMYEELKDVYKTIVFPMTAVYSYYKNVVKKII